MHNGNRITIATERAATRSGMARSITSSAPCIFIFDDISFLDVDPSSRW